MAVAKMAPHLEKAKGGRWQQKVWDQSTASEAEIECVCFSPTRTAWCNLVGLAPRMQSFHMCDLGDYRRRAHVAREIFSEIDPRCTAVGSVPPLQTMGMHARYATCLYPTNLRTNVRHRRLLVPQQSGISAAAVSISSRLEENIKKKSAGGGCVCVSSMNAGKHSSRTETDTSTSRSSKHLSSPASQRGYLSRLIGERHSV